MRLLFFMLSLSLLFPQVICAEKADRDKPVHLEADRAKVEDINRKNASRVSIFTGNVILTQGTLRIEAEKVIMKEDVNGFRHATAFGDLVSFRQKRDGMDEYIEGWSKRVEFDNNTDIIEMFRKARLKRGLDEVKGDYISYDMNSEFFQVIGSKRGVGTGPIRVKAVIQPKKKSNTTDQSVKTPITSKPITPNDVKTLSTPYVVETPSKPYVVEVPTAP